MRAALRLVLTSVAMLLHGGALAADLRVEAPQVVAGDKWEFAGNRNGVPTLWVIEILDRGDDGRIRARVEFLGREMIEYLDGSMNFLFGGRLDQPQVLAGYPMKTGDVWSFDIPLPSPHSSYTGNGRVIAQRTLTVPAGTFECLEVVAEGRRSTGTTYRNFYRRTRWFCPEIRWFAQEVYQVTTANNNNPAENASIEGEHRLIRFTPGRP